MQSVLVELCDKEKVTVLFGVPTMVLKMMSETATFSHELMESVRFAIVGGEPMPIPHIELWQKKGVPIRQGFGLTEVKDRTVSRCRKGWDREERIDRVPQLLYRNKDREEIRGTGRIE